MTDVETIQENTDDGQVTTKRIQQGAVTYEFVGAPGGTYEYQGDGDPPDGVVATLREHLGDAGEVAVDG